MFSVYFLSIIMAGITNGDYLGPEQSGIKTAFETVNTNKTNNCEWEKSRPITNANQFPYGNFVAVDTELFDDGISCGECYEIKCVEPIDSWGSCTCKPGASTTVMVMDFGHDVWGFDEVFDAELTVANQIFQPDNCLGDRSKMKITYRQVCCNHENNITIYNMDGITPYYLSFVVTEVRGYGSITNFYMREPGRSKWYECNRESNGINANWVCDPWTDYYEDYKMEGVEDGLGPFYNEPTYQLPISIKITDSAGTSLESIDLITNLTPEAEFDFGSNFFYSQCGDTTTSTPATTTNAPVTTTNAPVTTTNAPVTTTNAPATTTNAPVTTTNAHVTTTNAPVTTTNAPVTTTNAPVTTTNAPVTTTNAPVTTTSTTEECINSNDLDKPCTRDDECAQPCMRCCRGRHICEYRPGYQAKAMAALQHEMNEGVSEMAKDSKDPNMWGYITLIGVIAFILINNLFIGCWCLRKRSNGSGKYDFVSENDNDIE